MTEIDLSRAEWRKSSYSSQERQLRGSGPQPARASGGPGLQGSRRGELVVPWETWRAFLKGLRASQPSRTIPVHAYLQMMPEVPLSIVIVTVEPGHASSGARRLGRSPVREPCIVPCARCGRQARRR